MKLAPVPAPVRILACLHLVLGAAGLLAGSALCLAISADSSPRAVATLQAVGPVFLMATILYLGPAFIGGLGLLTGKAWAWVPIVVISVLLLPLFPIGTALGAFGFWALVHRKEAASASREREARHKASRPRTVAPGSTARSLLTMAVEDKHMPRMVAGPALRQPVARVEAGGSRSTAKIAYREDPSKTATCAHLQPIERAMRVAGLDLRLDRELIVVAPCAIDEARLRARFQPGPTVRYENIADAGRSYEDPRSAALKCDACRSLIYVIHPLEAPPDAAHRFWPPP